MGSTLIITASWWVDTPALRAWPLLADPLGWPRWWSSVARTDRLTANSAQTRQDLARAWRTALGRPLHLAVLTLGGQPHQWLSLRLQGDLQGQATFTLQPAATHGLDITCRCELQGPRRGLRPWAPVFERRARRLLQHLARDLGLALGCRTAMLGTWQGSAWHP